ISCIRFLALPQCKGNGNEADAAALCCNSKLVPVAAGQDHITGSFQFEVLRRSDDPDDYSRKCPLTPPAARSTQPRSGIHRSLCWATTRAFASTDRPSAIELP